MSGNLEETKTIEFKKGQVLSDMKILGIDGTKEVEGKRQITFIQLTKEKAPKLDPDTQKIVLRETGKTITKGRERTMTVADFRNFIDRKIKAGEGIH